MLSVETHRRAATGNTKSREVAGALAGTDPSLTARNSVKRPEVPWRGKYEGGMGSWQHSGWSSAEHVLHCVAISHSVATASGMAEQ